MSGIFASLTAGLLLINAPAPSAPVVDQTRFVAIAKEIKFFSAHAVLYDRNNGLHIFPQEWQDNWRQTRIAIVSGKLGVPELLGLLKDKHPKLRTLALAALAYRQDPKLLPHLAALMQDEAKTAPALHPSDPIGFTPPPLLLDQTVGQTAFQLVHFWMIESNYHRPEEFDAYWARRKDRDFCAGWFNARFVAIVQNTLPLDKARADRVRALRKELDRLPAVDRDWTLLWLVSGFDSDFYSQAVRCLATPEELLQAGKHLGAERWMKLLQGKKISDDPDLDTDQRSRPMLAAYVLKRSRQWLRPSDADAMLAVEKTLPTTPYCAIAAAELQPAKASKILHDALQRFAGEGPMDAWTRAELAAALLRLAGKEEISYLVEWFYGDKIDLTPHTQREGFLATVSRESAQANRELVARLIADPRFDKLDYQSQRAIALAVNRWVKEPTPQGSSINSRFRNGKNVEEVSEWQRPLKANLPAGKK